MVKNIDLTIVIVSSKIDFLKVCLNSVYRASNSISVEIILIDNASPENIGTEIKKDFPKLKVIRRDKNGGFGENNNMGMKVAKGRYVLLLNDDTKIIDKNIFREMIKWMDIHPKVGVSSCALLNADEKTYQGSGGYKPTLLRVFAWMFFLDDLPILDKIIKPYHPMHSWSPLYKGEDYYKEKHKQDWVTGAFYLMRKKALDEAGLFDEDFFLYVEEVELSLRFLKAGWGIWYLPKWKIIHYGQTTIGSENSIIYELKNMFLLYKKHFPKWQIGILRAILKSGTLLRIVVFGFIKGKNTANTYIKAFKEL